MGVVVNFSGLSGLGLFKDSMSGYLLYRRALPGKADQMTKYQPAARSEDRETFDSVPDKRSDFRKYERSDERWCILDL